MARSIEEFVRACSDRTLIQVEDEILMGIVANTSHTHEFVRRINRMIDSGDIKFNDRARHVYLPTVRMIVERELARRYTLAVEYGMVQADAVTRKVKDMAGQVPGQMRLEDL